MILFICWYFLVGVIAAFIAGIFKQDWLYTTAIMWPVYIGAAFVITLVVLIVSPFWIFNKAGEFFAK